MNSNNHTRRQETDDARVPGYSFTRPDYDRGLEESRPPPPRNFHHEEYEESLEGAETDICSDYEFSDVEMQGAKAIRTIEYVTYDETESTSASPSPPTKHEEGEEQPRDSGCCMRILTHLKRVINWRIVKLGPMQKEAQFLDQNEVLNSTLRSYLVWRRSMLIVAAPSIFLSAILAWVEFGKYYGDNSKVLNALGDFIFLIPPFASTALFITVVVVLCRWTRWRQTARLFKIGWALSFILPFLPAMFPLRWLLNSCDLLFGRACEDGDLVIYKAAVAIDQFSLAIRYAMQLFPILITFPGGLARASLKIRGLLPESTLSSWILVITAPFQSVVFLMALVLLIQLSGNISLFVGTIFLFCAPWIYVLRRHLYVGVPTEEREKQLDRTQFVIGLLLKLGGICFLVWAFTGMVGDVKIVGSASQTGDTQTDDSQTGPELPILTYGSLLQLIFEAIGRILATTVLFADMLLRMTVTNWRQNRDRHDADGGKIDQLFRDIEHSISSPKSKEARSEEGSNKTSDSS